MNIFRVVRMRFAGTAEQVGSARQLVARALGRRHPGLDDAVLLTSETVTNAVRHSRSGRPGGHFTVTVEHTGSWVRVEVADEGSDTLPWAPRTVHPDDTGGRGVGLMDELAARWGVTRDRSGTCVWFDLGEHTAPHREPAPA